MLSYALVSAADEPQAEWRTLDAAMSHLTAVESISRQNSRNNHILHQRILECEMTIRKEWTRVHQLQPTLSLGGVIHLVAQRHPAWPLMSEFRMFASANRKQNDKSLYPQKRRLAH